MARAPLVISWLLGASLHLGGCAPAAAAPGVLARELTAAVAPRLPTAPAPAPLDLDAVCAGWSPPEEVTPEPAPTAPTSSGRRSRARATPSTSSTPTAAPPHHLPGPRTRASRAATRSAEPAKRSRSALAVRAEREAKAALGRELRRRAEEALGQGGGKRRP